MIRNLNLKWRARKMAGVNKVILIGNLGKDPEIKYSASGMAVCKFTVATNEKVKGKEKVEWHNIVTFDKLAEICGEFLNKGSHVYIEGKIQTSNYEKDGVTKYFTEIVTYQMQILDPSTQHGKNENMQAQPDPDSIPF
jgi:single-strand DNA-binding protein